MVLVLAIGDLHIPARATDLPPKFKKLLVPGKIQSVLCTGNLTARETLDFLRHVAPDVCAVRGDLDELPLDLPATRTVVHGPLRFGVVHGHQVVPCGDHEALAALARQMDVDVLVAGGTHAFSAYEYEGRFFVNPGSATGAYIHQQPDNAAAGGGTAGLGADGMSPTPSFVLMDLQGPAIVMYVYQLINGELKIEKVDWTLRSRE
ncbi:Metallo-dependent phosphatase-like protein [Hyaloraphidium curvatum]|nr:Metallo-dependent phosphatase-like protein [Hyaloraphidium curvatum]